MIILKFDLSKQDAELLPPNPILYGRIGDKQSPEVEIHLTQNGSVIDLTGHTVQFEGMTASGARIIDAGGISATAAQLRAGTFRYSFSERGFSSTGPFRLAHFSIVRGDIRRSTNDFSLQVLGTVDMTAPEAESILTEYNELVRKLQEKFDRATQDLTRQVNELVRDPAWDRLREIQTQLEDIERQVEALDFDQIVTDKMKEIEQMVDRRLRDIEEKINDIDPVTLTEVNQELGSLILGKPIVHNQEMTFVGKVPASVVENPHRVVFGNSSLSVLPNPGPNARSEEFSQTDYRKLNGSDDEFVTVVGHRSNEAFVSFQWNILEEIRRRYPYWFTGIEREDVAILRGMFQKVTLEIECYGTPRLRLAHWSGSQWVADPFIASDEQVLTLTKEGPLTTSSAPETGIRIDGTAAFALLGDTIVNNHQIGIGKTTLQVELAVSLPDLYQRLNA